jgi:2,4-dichlorophenol 6-monooxygenase
LEALGLEDTSQNVEQMQAGIDGLADDSPEGVVKRTALREALELKDYEFNALGVELGQRYDSAAVVKDGTAEPAYTRDPELYYHATTWPGARLPHCWLGDKGRQVSTHDLAGKGGFTLLTGVTGHPWVAAAQKAAQELGIEVRAYVIGPKADYSDLYDDWARLREVAEDGCVLVRPDAHVAWRSQSVAADPAAELTHALRSVLAR